MKAAIAAFPGAVLEDDVANQVYPQAANAVGKRETFVGRIRKDLDVEKVFTCGLFLITSLKALHGTLFKLLKHFTNAVLSTQLKILNSNSNNNSNQFLLEADL